MTPAVKTTRYFEEQVLCERPYLRGEECERRATNPIPREVQSAGRYATEGLFRSRTGACGGW